jgi:hypothetical protein
MANEIQLTPEQRKEKIKKVVKLGLLGLLVAPVIGVAIFGVVGLIVGAAIAFTAIQLAPVFADKVANLRMKMIVAEAQRNPIETMRNIYMDNMKVIQEKDEKIKNFEARLGDYCDKMAGFAKKYPEEAARYQEVADKMKRLLQRQKQKQKAAKSAAAAYKDNIEKASAIYDMACEANAVTQLAGDVEKQVFQDIKKQVAFDAVNHQFNQAVAELSTEADTEPDLSLPAAPTQLSNHTNGYEAETVSAREV